jgi:hypothetical protein
LTQWSANRQPSAWITSRAWGSNRSSQAVHENGCQSDDPPITPLTHVSLIDRPTAQREFGPVSPLGDGPIARSTVTKVSGGSCRDTLSRQRGVRVDLPVEAVVERDTLLVGFAQLHRRCPLARNRRTGVVSRSAHVENRVLGTRRCSGRNPGVRGGGTLMFRSKSKNAPFPAPSQRNSPSDAPVWTCPSRGH